MLVLIDESGCPGFELNKGSSPYFTLAMVIFHDLLEAEKASKIIEELRLSLKIKSEFKFSKTHPNIRDIFFTKLNSFDFMVRALVIEKSKITSSYLKQHHDNFYNYFLKMLIEYDAEILNNATIKIDGRGTRIFKKTLNQYLKNQTGQHKIHKVKFINSKSDNLVQLADMVVGAIARANYKDLKKESCRWLEMLQKYKKIHNIWYFDNKASS